MSGCPMMDSDPSTCSKSGAEREVSEPLGTATRSSVTLETGMVTSVTPVAIAMDPLYVLQEERAEASAALVMVVVAEALQLDWATVRGQSSLMTRSFRRKTTIRIAGAC